MQITQHAGALTDFPRSMEHCTTFPIAADASKRCANCYCYVCDAPAAKCAQWATHCAARHGDPRWRAERAAHARGDTQQGAQQLAARGTTTAGHCYAGRAVTTSRAILEAVTRVYPEEAQAPAGFTTGITLRPYQRQSLAFMLNVERRTGGELPTLGLQGTRGGWLCDEVGMGKTAVVIATCLANRATHKRGSDTQWAQMLRLLTRTPDNSRPAPNWSGARLPLKATLVLTNVSLVGQWEDEFKKFAPGLRVQRFYGGGKFTKRGIGDWRDVDVLVSTFTTPFYTANRFGNALIAGAQFHRIVIDECHLARTSTRIHELRATHKWAVTGTPMSKSVYDLMTQASIIDQQTSEFSGLMRDASMHHRGARDKLVAALRRVIIRHTKAQRIGGAAALSLPDEVVSTVLLDQTTAEQQMYRAAFAQSAYRRRNPADATLRSVDGPHAAPAGVPAVAREARGALRGPAVARRERRLPRRDIHGVQGRTHGGRSAAALAVPELDDLRVQREHGRVVAAHGHPQVPGVGPRQQGLRDHDARGQRRHYSDGGGRRVPARPLRRPGRRGAGGGPHPPPRPDAARAPEEVHHEGYRRGGHRGVPLEIEDGCFQVLERLHAEGGRAAAL